MRQSSRSGNNLRALPVVFGRSEGTLRDLRIRPKQKDGKDGAPLVLVVGPAPGQSGGISSVMSYLEAESSPHGEFDIRYLDTLKKGRWSIAAFLGTLVYLAVTIGAARIGRRPMVVHLNVSTRGSTYRKWVFSRVCTLSRTPYVVHLHGSKYRKFYSAARPIVRRAVLSLFGGSAGVIVLGRVWHDYVVDVLEVPGYRVVVVPNGTPGFALAGRNGRDERHRVRVVFSGRLSKEKGIVDLLEAADLLYQERQDFELVLMGDSRDATLLDSARSRAYCVVTGWVPNADVVSELSNSDVFILPSHDEGLPMSMIEAMSMALPLIVTDVGAISDVVCDGKEGFLVEAGDIERLRTAMESLIADKGLRERMGRNARQRWESELQASQMARGIESRWFDVLSAHYGAKDQ